MPAKKTYWATRLLNSATLQHWAARTETMPSGCKPCGNVMVVAGSERWRRWMAAEKLRVAEDSFPSGVAEFARERDMQPNPALCGAL
jgi:hypothetical protein